MNDDERAIDLARDQHGLITRRQARSLGLSDDQIDHRLTSGRWRRERHGVLLVGAAPSTWEQRVHGLCLGGGDDVVASHRTAARLWSLVDAVGRIEVTVRGTRRVRLTGATVHQSILLPTVDLAVRSGIPCTAMARTLADLSGGQDPRVVGSWIDQALRHSQLDLLELRSCLARLAGPGRRNLRVIRQVVGDLLPDYDPGDSDLEVRALRALHDAGLPAPVQQHPVRLGSGGGAVLDLAYPEHLVAVELDGWAFHGTRVAFDRDRLRRNELTLLGWHVLQFTASMSDDALVRTVAEAIGHDLHRTA